MEYKIKRGSPEKQRSACLVLAVFEHKAMSLSASIIDKTTDGIITALIKRGDITGECGEMVLLPRVDSLPAERILLVGCGSQ